MNRRGIPLNSAFAAALLAGSLAVAQPVQAKVVEGTYTGTVALGYDEFGRFGTPGADLGALDFTAIVRIDTAPPGAQTYEPGFSSSLFGYGAAGPVRIALTIDGVTQHFGDFFSVDARTDYPADFSCPGCAAESNWSHIAYAYDDEYDVGNLHYFSYAFAGFTVANATGLISGLDHGQTLDLTETDPVSLSGSVFFETGVRDNLNFTSSFSEYLAAYLTPTSVTWRVIDAGGGVPEPAGWALMILGFGAAGASLRRRAAASTLQAF